MERELTAWMEGWWKAHPGATLTEMEVALDEQVAEVRARALAATLSGSELAAEAERRAREVCPVCGAKLVKSGRHKRKLQEKGGQAIEIERAYMRCPQCGQGFFPPGP